MQILYNFLRIGVRFERMFACGKQFSYEPYFLKITFFDVVNDFLVFGRETRGLPESLLSRVYDRCLRIPMVPGARSLNLSNSVAIVLYEALRTLDFPGMQEAGALTGREDESAPWMDYV